MNLLQSSFPEWYKEIEKLGDPLMGISDRIDFERIRPFLCVIAIEIAENWSYSWEMGSTTR